MSANTNIIKTLLAARIREVTTTDSATNESKTTVKAVNLKASDFSDKSEWKAYSRRLLDLSPVMMKAAAAFDSKDEAFTAARKEAVEALQGIVNLLSNVGGFDKFNVQKKDVNYIIRLAYGRKVDKEGKKTVVTVKSKSALQTLVEDVIFYHINNMKLPDVTMTLATQTAIAKAQEKDAANKPAGKEKTAA